VHLIGRQKADLDLAGLPLQVHPSLTSGPALREWGDDWSRDLARYLSRLSHPDVCFVHLGGHASARLACRAAAGARTVVVFHGAFMGEWDRHLDNADRLVVIRREVACALIEKGARAERVVQLSPSIAPEFAPAAGGFPDGPPILGFVGRAEASKGIFDIPEVVASLAESGIDARVEIVGPCSFDQQRMLDEASDRVGVRDRVSTLGQLSSKGVAAKMREWRLLLVPSYSEGFGLVVAEACASRLPVAAVAGVLSAELATRPGVATAVRNEYAGLVGRMLESNDRPPVAGWTRSHEEAAAEFDTLIDVLPSWEARSRPRRARLQRGLRLKPLQRTVRSLVAAWRLKRRP